MLNKIYSDEVTVKDIFLFRIFWYIVEKRNDNSGIMQSRVITLKVSRKKVSHAKINEM